MSIYIYNYMIFRQTQTCILTWYEFRYAEDPAVGPQKLRSWRSHHSPFAKWVTYTKLTIWCLVLGIIPKLVYFKLVSCSNLHRWCSARTLNGLKRKYQSAKNEWNTKKQNEQNIEQMKKKQLCKLFRPKAGPNLQHCIPWVVEHSNLDIARLKHPSCPARRRTFYKAALPVEWGDWMIRVYVVGINWQLSHRNLDLPFSEHFLSCGNGVRPRFLTVCRVASDGRAGSSWLAHAIPIVSNRCFLGLQTCSMRNFCWMACASACFPSRFRRQKSCSWDSFFFLRLKQPDWDVPTIFEIWDAPLKCPIFLKSTTLNMEEPLHAPIF